MKHLPIGYIKEHKKQDKIIYTVSLFHHKVHEVFNDRADALEVVRFHADSFLKIGETDAICVKYYNYKKQMHYLMIDTVWTEDKDSPEIHEQTKFEYYSSHSLFFPRWAKRRIINERRVTSSDILRAAINYRPWFIFVHLLIAALICVFAGIFVIDSIEYLNSEGGSTSEKRTSIWLAFTLFMISFLASASSYIALYITRRKITSVSNDYSEINWRGWYKWRMRGAVIISLVAIGSLNILFFFMWSYTSDGHVKHYNGGGSYLLVALYGLIGLYILLLFSMVTFMIFAVYQKRKNLYRFFDANQRNEFKKWFHDRKIIRDIVANESKDFFVIPSELSEYPVKRELQASQDIRNKYSLSEYRKYKKKAKRNFQSAMKIHIKNIQEAKEKHEHISKNNS